MLDRPHRQSPAVALLGSVLLLFAVAASPQSTGTFSSGAESPATQELRERLGASGPARAGRADGALPAFEAAVDPAEHHLAPGDELALGIWGSVDVIVPLVVSADGQLVIPTVGLVPTGGLTLAQAQERVAEACRPAYPRAQISLSLIRPGLLRIPLTGQVRQPGIYEIPSTFRLEDLIALAGGLREGADTRALQMTRTGEASRACDLLAWRVLGDLGGNPVLQTGDRVHAPAASAHYRLRGLFPERDETSRPASGLVDRPFLAETHLVAARAGDTLALVLAAAGWLGANLRGDGVWVERADGERRWVPTDAAAAERLQPGDVIEIPFAREWVSVNGAVQRPGLYPFLPGQTVADYVSLAGGPNQYGRTGGWKVYDAAGNKMDLSAGEPVAAGAHVWVPERQWYRLWTILTPLGTALAVVVSMAALLARN